MDNGSTSLESAFQAAGGDMGRRISAHDWASSPTGPIHEWPSSLRTAVGIMLESRHPMLIWWGREFTMFYNDAFALLAGTKHPAGLGQHGWEMFAEIWPTIGPMLEHVLSHGEATWVDDQLLVMNRRGLAEETYWTYSFSPIRDSAGQVRGVFTATSDTTGRVLGERRLRTLSSLGDVSAVQATTVEQACTAAAVALAGHRADLPAGLIYLLSPEGTSARLVADYGFQPGSAIVAPTLPGPATEDSIWKVGETGSPTVVTGLSTRHPGSVEPVAHPIGAAEPDTAVILPLAAAGQSRPAGLLVLVVSPYRELDGEYRAFLDLVARQVATALADARAYTAQLRRAEELAELDRAKTAFFSNISHEFRTPLTLIMGPVQELRTVAEFSDDPRLRAEVDSIHRNGLRLGKLVNTLLDSARLQAGQLSATYEPVDLAALTAELASVFQSAIEQAGLALVVECTALGAPAYVDREMWEKVVLNLLSNALKFTFDGQITVSLRRRGTFARLDVADTGTGIPPEHLNRVFERFHRVHHARARTTEGSGIGLALARELVVLHGGEITVSSTLGVGTTFTVTLPLGRDHLPAEQVRDNATHPGAATVAEPFVAEALRWLPTRATPEPTPERTPESDAGSGVIRSRILIVDDNADMRDYLQRLLRARHEVHAVGDGLAALHAARSCPPELIVSDVMMPELDGIELVAALRADPLTASVPVLLLSARAGQEAAAEGLAAGADDYLVKPFSAAELLSRVQAHLRLGLLRRGAERRFQTVANQSPAMIWLSDAQGHREYFSQAWLAFTDREIDGLLGEGWWGSLHPTDEERYRTVVGAAREACEPWEVEYRLQHRRGGYRWVLEHAVPITAAPGVTGWIGSCVDIHTRTLRTERRERVAAARLDSSQRELARFREIAEQTSDLVGMADVDGVAFYLNPAGRRLLDIAPTDDVTAIRMEQYVTEQAVPRLLEVALPAAAADGVWAGEMEFAGRDGAPIPMWQVILAHRDHRGELEFFSTVARDLRERQQAQRALQEEAARMASEATSARLRAMVDGLAAIVWEADATTWEFTFVSDRAEELLGYPPQRWLGDTEFWPSIIHPADRAEAVRFCAEGTAAGRDYNFSYRALAADGRVVWLHDVVHVVCDAAGRPVELQGVMIDITEQKRSEHATELLAEVGRLLAEPGSAQDKLELMVRHTRAAFGDMAVVSVVEPDGLLRRVAVAHTDPAMQRALLELPPIRLPDEFAAQYRAGRPMVVPITEQLIHSVARDEADAQARLAFGALTGLMVPLVADGQLFGVLSYITAESRSYDAADLTLAEELGRRVALMVQDERRHSRNRHLREITAAFASAGSVAEMAQRLASVVQILGATGLSVYLLDPERGLRLEHAMGYPAELLEAFALIRLDDPVPIADSARTGEPVWLRNRAEWTQRYPHLGRYAALTDNHAAAALPLLAAGRVVGTLALSFGTVREFVDDEREFALTLVATAAQAFERAAIADERRHIAETLQRSLLPQKLPELPRLGLAAHYQPGTAGTQAGGDWYDVIPLSEVRVAIVVGDVVGHGTPAAAVMGRLRNALAGYLLEGHPAATALEHLDHFAGRVEGALGSSVACVVLNTVTGELRWARAGHLPPLVIDGEGARFLDDARGAVLGVPGRAPFEEGSTQLDPGTSVLLYTDGLVERRGEVIDDSLARLRAGAASLAARTPAALLTALLERTLHQPGPADDVAVIVARLLPEPVHERLLAHPTQLATLRRSIAVWAAAVGLSGNTASDLQLALGEAVANAIEHAYASRTPGEVDVQVRYQPGGWVDVSVRDFGTWRPTPEAPGYRGHGLTLIREVTADMTVDPHEDGTEIRFRLAVPQEHEPA